MPSSDKYPFTGTSSSGVFSEKLTILDTQFKRHIQDFEKLHDEIKDLSRKLETINLNVTLIVDQRDKADKSLSRFKSAGLTLCTGLALALIVVLVKFAFIMQINHLPPIGP